MEGKEGGTKEGRKERRMRVHGGKQVKREGRVRRKVSRFKSREGYNSE
jgi:hypothetical protein